MRLLRIDFKHLGLFLGVFLGLACGSVQAQTEISLGGIFDLTSDAGAQWGVTEKNSFLLAISDFERENSGLKVSYKIEDSAYDSKQTVSAFQKLTSVDKIKFIVGPTWEVFVPVIPLCEAKEVICVAISCSNESFDSGKLKSTFTFWFDERLYGSTLADEINRQGLKRVAVIAGSSPYFDAVQDAALKTLEVTPLLSEKVLPDNRDFRSLIVKTPKDLDALLILLLPDGQVQSFFRQWHELRTDKPAIFTDDSILYAEPKEDLLRHGQTIMYSFPEFTGASLEEFSEKYFEKFNEKPQAPSGVVTYDATKVLLSCLGQKRSSIETVRKCIRATENYKGYSGVLSFGGGNKVTGRRMTLAQFK